MQSFETSETIVHETDSQTPSPENRWTGDRPIYLSLAVSALASAAAVPVILAIMGPMETLKLLYPSLLIGLLVGATGLLVAGLATNLVRALRAQRTGQAIPQAKPSRGLRGKLAFG